MALPIHQDRAIMMTPPVSPVITSQGTGDRQSRDGRLSEAAEQGIRTEGDRSLPG